MPCLRGEKSREGESPPRSRCGLGRSERPTFPLTRWLRPGRSRRRVSGFFDRCDYLLPIEHYTREQGLVEADSFRAKAFVPVRLPVPRLAVERIFRKELSVAKLPGQPAGLCCLVPRCGQARVSSPFTGWCPPQLRQWDHPTRRSRPSPRDQAGHRHAGRRALRLPTVAAGSWLRVPVPRIR